MVKSDESPSVPPERASVLAAGPTALAERPRAVLDSPACRALFRTLFRRELGGLRSGWPRLVSAAEASGWLRSHDVMIELSRTPLQEPFDFAIVLTAEGAARLCDLLLDAGGPSGFAGRRGGPSEAECGVLAYAAARFCAALTSSVRVRDVRPFEGAELPARFVLWPLSLEASPEWFDACLLLAENTAAALPDRHPLELVLEDECPAADLEQLTPGQALISDAWPLTLTSEGLVGEATGVLPSCEMRLALRLSGAALKSRGPAQPPAATRVELQFARTELPLLELARLASGAVVSCSLERSQAELRSAGTCIAAGEAVLHRGALGIRITAVARGHSAEG